MHALMFHFSLARALMQQTLLCFAVSVAICLTLQTSTKAAEAAPPLFARENLVAWCIVPFDGKRRGPAERAEMARRLGFTKVAYDWRAEHVPQFEAEILQYKR